MAQIKDQAVCIRLIDWSETSQIVALLTQEHGKVRGVAKGSKRMSPSSIARFSGGIELLTMGQVVARIRPSSDLANITEWDLQEPYPHLRADLRGQQLGLYAADAVNAMLVDHDPHPNVFAAVTTLLSTLADLAQREASLLAFQWRLLADCGYQPRLDAPDRKTYIFDPRAGGLIDHAHAMDTPAGPWRVRGETVELLRRVAAGDPLDGDDAAIGRANRLLCVYMRALLDRQLPTMAIVLNDKQKLS